MTVGAFFLSLGQRLLNRVMNLSFSGCGFLGIYHVGVAACFRRYAPHVLDYKVTGTSAGALAAIYVALGLPPGKFSYYFTGANLPIS